MNEVSITILVFVVLMLLLASGLPITFCLGGAGIAFAYFLWGTNGLQLAATSMYGMITNFVLIAAPLFVFMAYMLEYSGIGDNLYESMRKWFGPLKGGLAMGTVLICALIAAMCGLSSAGTLSMGIIALPAMLKRGYSKDIALGCIGAGGALGILIPPSIPFIVYAALTGSSVGRLFLGGVIPGILLTIVYVIYIGIRSYLQPKLCPALPPQERAGWTEKMISLRLLILPVLLVIAVLGSIFTGIATPTEGAAVGAFGSIVVCVINRRFNWKSMKMSAYQTVRTAGMVMWIMAAAGVFNSVYTGLGAPQFISATIVSLSASPIVIVIVMQLIVFALGFIMDPAGITMITVPVFIPIVLALGFDPVWFGVLMIMNFEMAYLTPPFGWNLFFLQSVAPKGVTMSDIYHSVWWFVCLQMLGLILVLVYPAICMWLPNMVMGL